MTSFDSNKNKVCLFLKDNVGGLRVKSCTRSRAGSYDYRSCDHGVTKLNSDKKSIEKLMLAS